MSIIPIFLKFFFSQNNIILVFHLVYPVGDEIILESSRLACFLDIDKDARDEGTDYEGDCSVFSFLPKGDRALRRDESNTKLSEVRVVASCSLCSFLNALRAPE